MQELEAQLEQEQALKVIADKEDAEALVVLRQKQAARRIQRAWHAHVEAKAAASGKKSKKKGKAGGKKAAGGKAPAKGKKK